MRRSLTALLVTPLLLATAACGDDAVTDASPSGDDAIPGLTVRGEVGESVEVEIDAPLDTTSDSQVLAVGDGNPLMPNDAFLLHLYIGNATTGKEAISTYTEGGEPIQVHAAEAELFKAVVDAVVEQPRGSRVAVTAPVAEVWGAQGAPQLGLKPEHEAVFVADIVSVPPKEVVDGPEGTEVAPPADMPTVVEEDGQVTGLDWSAAPKQAPTDLTVVPLIEGDGPVAEAESMVTFDYYGAVWGEDEPFDESFSGEPTPFGVGVNSLIGAWDKEIPGLRRGSRVLIIAPPSEAYGDREQPGIPAGSTLAFVVDVLGVDE